MLNTIFITLLPFLALFSSGSDRSVAGPNLKGLEGNTGTLEKMIVANGNIAMSINLNKLNGTRSRSKNPEQGILRFDAENNSFFSVLIFNNEFRGPLPSSMPIIPQNSLNLPAKLSNAGRTLMIENLGTGGHFELAVRDSKTGFTFFNIEGHQYEYDPSLQTLGITQGRILISEEFANEMGRKADAGTIIGEISIFAALRPVEVTKVVNGEAEENYLPAGAGAPDNAGTRPGPDVVVGDVNGLAQFGAAAGTQVGLALGTDSCNYGTQNLNWFQNPSNDHPVIPQNLYRMSGGATNDQTFEQIGQSQVKHAFTALTNNLCGLGCNGVGGSQLGSGCSDPYSASLNSGPNLGSKAWINPFTGFYPRNDSATPNNSHTGHAHVGPTHRILTEINDLSTTLNPGATYYAEGQYVTPHEYAWCQANPTQCNMNNNVSYRRYSVTGTASPFSFSPVGATQREKAAINAWTGASFATIQPNATTDGIGIIGYKVTNPSAGVWHYEYAVYNQNLDRGIQSFSVPIGNGVTVSNIGFHAPPQHPGMAGDGTSGNAGFSSAAWTGTQANGAITWSSETLAQNPNANAIRWGSLYNFRFDSNRPPQNMSATVGFFKTGSPITAQVQGPMPVSANGPFTVSGRLTSFDGQPVRNATVAISDMGGNTVGIAVSSPFGLYTVTVPSGASYGIDILTKRFVFEPRTITVNGNLSGVDFIAAP